MAKFFEIKISLQDKNFEEMQLHLIELFPKQTVRLCEHDGQYFVKFISKPEFVRSDKSFVGTVRTVTQEKAKEALGKYAVN